MSSAFFRGVLGGAAEGFKEGFEDIQKRIALRADGAAQFHVARATREEEKFDERQEDFEDGVKLLHGFFSGDPNAWEKAGAVFSQYGGTLEGAQQAAKAGRLAMAKAQRDAPDKKVDFNSFFEFAQGVFDPHDPLTFEGLLAQTVGNFTYTPNTKVDMGPTSGFAKLFFGDVGGGINKEVSQRLAARGIDTSKAQPIERVLPSAHSKRGSLYMNLNNLVEIDQKEATLDATKTGTTLTSVQAEHYKEKTTLLEKEINKYDDYSKAKIESLVQSAGLDAARIASMTAKTLLDDRFGEKERLAGLQLQWQEIKYKFNSPRDYEELDAGYLSQIAKATMALEDAKGKAPIGVIDKLKSNLNSLNVARQMYMNDPLVSAATKADIISKSSAGSLWKTSFQGALLDAGLEGVQLDLEGTITQGLQGNEFRVFMAKRKAILAFKSEYGGLPKADRLVGTLEQGNITSLQNSVEAKLAPLYEKEDGSWHKGGIDAKDLQSGDDTLEGEVRQYQSSAYDTFDQTIRADWLETGKIYEIPFKIYQSVMLARGNPEKKAETLAKIQAALQSKYYNSKDRTIFGVWAGGPKERFNFRFSNLRKTPRTVGSGVN